MPGQVENNSIDQDILNHLNTCLPEADTLLGNLEALSIDLPYIKSIHHNLDLIIDKMHDLTREIQQEQQRLSATIK